MKKERFEDYLDQVEKIVTQLEQENIDLEKSLEKYEAGIKALKKCYEILSAMEKKIEIITRDEKGNITTKPLKKEQD
jgi:exodeoxyribonuclease VII small subunit